MNKIDPVMNSRLFSHWTATFIVVLFLNLTSSFGQVFTCNGNLVSNPSFESGTTGWSWFGGGLVQGTYAAVFGNYSGQFQISNGSSNGVHQTVSSGNYNPGDALKLEVHAGTHNPGYTHHVGFWYYDSNWNWLGDDKVEVNSQLPTMTKYTVLGTLPNNCHYVRVFGNGSGDWIKTDGWCVTPVNVAPQPADWSYDCADGKTVELDWNGIKGNSNYTENFSNSSNIERVVVEIVYKGSHPGSFMAVEDNGGTEYLLPEVQINGNSSHEYAYRGEIVGSISSVSFNNIPNPSEVQSIVFYIFRDLDDGLTSVGKFIERSGYRTSFTENLAIPQGVSPRDITVTIPVSEMTYDCRELTFTVQAKNGGSNAGASQSVTINPATPSGGCCIEAPEVILTNVPANANNIDITVFSPNGDGWSCPPTGTQNGQSFVIAAALHVDVECSCPIISSSISGDLNICNGESTTLSVNASGGNSPYTISWSNGLGNGSSKTVSPSNTTNYMLTITDDDGCSATTSVEVVVNPNPTVDAGVDVEICSNQQITLTANASSGTPNYTYSWSHGLGNGASKTVSPNSNTNYNVTVTDSKGCSDSDDVMVSVRSSLNPGSIASNEGNCGTFNPAIISSSANASGGNCSISYEWEKKLENGSWQTISGATSSSYDPGVIIATTSYRRKATNCCESAYSNTVIKTVGSTIIANAGPDQNVCDGGSATLNASLGYSGGAHGFILRAEPESTSSDNIKIKKDGSSGPRLVIYSNGNPSPTTLYQSQRARIESDNTDHNHDDLKVGYKGGEYDRSLIDFDISSISGTIDQAFLVVKTEDSGDLDVGVYAIDEEWNEDEVTWDEKDQNVTWDDSGVIGSGDIKWDEVTFTSKQDYSFDVTALVDAWVNGGNQGSGSYTYLWSTGSTNSSITVNPSSTTTYTLTVTDTNSGCTDSDQVIIEVSNDMVDPGQIGNDEGFCTGFDPAVITSIVDGSGECNNSVVEDCCDEGDKPNLFRLLYNGESCAQSNNNQGTVGGKWDCSGDAGGDPQVYISVNDGQFSGTVDLNTTFDIYNGGDKLSNPVEISIYSSQGGSLLQTIEIHTSCSAPIVGGDQFGSLVLQYVEFENNYTCEGVNNTIAYKWESKTSSTSWTEIPNEVGPTYDPSFINVTTQYRRLTLNCCGAIESNVVTKSVHAVPEASASKTDATCGLNNGLASASAGGGMGPYTYSWSNNGTTATISNLSPGTYTVTVKDANLCEDVASVTINNIAGPTVSISGDNNICEGQSTTLSTSVNGGSPSYNYLWSDNSISSSISVSPTTTTTYTVSVTDDNNCTSTASSTVTVEPQIVSGISGPSTRCAEEDMTFVVSPAVSGATYAWSLTGPATPNSGSGASITAQWANSPGTYNVELTITKGECEKIYNHSVIITNKVFAAGGPDQEICQGGSTILDGSGPGSADFSWSVVSGDPTSIDGGVDSEDLSVSPLVTTVYQLTVSQNGCTRIDQVTVEVNTNLNPVADAGGNKSVCIEQDLVIGGTPTGTPPVDDPTATLSYTWSPSSSLNAANIANPTFSNGIPGNYSYEVIVEATNTGCKDTSEMVVTVNDNPSVNAGNDVTICDGNSTQLMANASGGNSPYTYTWNNGLGNGQTKTVSPSSTTTNIVTATDQNNCIAEDEVIVNVQETFNSGISGPNSRCAEEDVTFIVSPPVSGASYEWTLAGPATPNSGTGSSITAQWADQPGQYDVELKVTKGECEETYVHPIVITNKVFAIAGPDQEVCLGGSVTLDGSGPASGNYNWKVLSGDPTSIDVGGATDDIVVSPLVTTVYELTVSQNGCTRIDQVTVQVNTNLNPVADAGQNDFVCSGEDYILGGSPTGTPPLDDPTANLGYIWSPNSNINQFTIANPTFNSEQLGNHTYEVIVYSLNTGCADTAEVTLTVEAKAKVGDFVWDDSNNNGIQDAGESGINNVQVELYDANTDELVTSTTTNTSGGNAGHYEFEVCKGDYYIVFGEVSNAQRTSQNVGNDALDSDANSNTGRTENFNLSAGENNTDIDAGYTSIADLELTKEADDTTPNVGQILTYSITIENKGPDAATGVSIEDIVPNGLSNVSNISNGGVMNSGTITWSGLSIASGSSVVLTYEAEVMAPGTGVSYKNVSQVTASDQYDIDSTPDNDDGDQSEDDEDNEEVTPQQSDLELTKEADDTTPNVGQILTYSITIENKGPDAATGVSIEDIVPNGLSNVSNISNGGVMNSGTITWSGLSIASGSSVVLTYEAEVMAPGTGVSYKNVSQVTASDQYDIDSTPDNDDGNQSEDDEDNEEVTPQQSDLELTKEADDTTPNVGQILTYSITIENKGPDAATGVSIEDIVPNGLSNVSNISNGGVMNSGTITWSGLSIASGSSVVLTYEAEVMAPGTGVSYKNVSQVTASDQYDVDSTPDNDDGDQSEDDEDNEEVTPQQSDLELTKEADDTTPNVGQILTYSITIENKGPDAATGVSIEDIVPNGLSNVSNISNGGVMNSGTITWSGLSIASGSSVVLTYEAEVMAPGTGVSYKNVSQVTASDQYDIDSTPDNDDGDQSEDDEDNEEVTPQQSDLELTKEADDTTPNVGQILTYSITIENKGPDAATGVSIEDIVPNGLSNVSNISNGGVMNSGTITWSGLSIASGSSVVLTYEAEVMAPGTGVSYKNVSQVTASDQYDIDSTPDNDDGDQSEDDEDNEEVTPQQSDLELTKEADDTTPNVGQILTYSITIENKGPDAATGVSIEDIVPNGLSNVSNISNGGVMNSGTITWSGLSIASGSSVVLTYEAEVMAPGTGVSYKNVSQVTASDQYDVDSTPDNDDGDQSEDDEDNEEVTPQQSDLELTKEADDTTPNVGQILTYSITIENKGPDAATGVSIEDIVPNGLSNVSNISNGGVMNSGTITWSGLSIASGSSVVLTYEAEVMAPGTGVSYKNVSQVTASDQYDIDSTPDNDDGDQSEDDEDNEEVTPQQSDLELTKEADDTTPNVGQILTYSITIENKGPDAATGVSIEDIVPNGLSNVSNISNGGVMNSGTITWSGLSIASGSSVVLTYEAEVMAPGTGVSYKNVSQVTASDQYDIDSTPDNDDGDQSEDDEDNEEVTPQQSDLELTKEADDTTPNVGQILTYSITIENKGPDAATGVSIEDIVPNGLSNVSNISNGGVMNSGTITWSGLSIASGSSVVLTYEAEVMAPGTGVSYKNVSQVTASDQYDIDSTPDNDDGDQSEDDEDNEEVTPQQSDLELTKEADDTTPNVGQILTYSITIENKGPDAATGVSIEDIVPNGLSNVSNISNGGVMNSGTITWSGLSIASGSSVVLTYEAEVMAPGTGVSYKNVSQVTASDQYDIDSTPDNDDGDQSEDDEDNEEVTPQQSDLELTKEADDTTPNVGQILTYSITIENKGPDAATGVSIEDIVPNGLSNVSNISNGGVMNSGTITWSGLSIASGSSVVLTYEAEVMAPGTGVSYKNVSQVTASDQYDIDSTPDNDDGDQSEDDEDNEEVTPQQSDLELTKEADDTTPNVGQILTYSITIENKGPDAATGVSIEDIVPNGLSNVSNISNGGVMNSGTITWSGLSIASGSSVVLTYEAEVMAPGTGVSYKNVSQVTASDQYDIDSTPDNDDGDQSEDDEDNEEVTPQQSDLELTKEADDTTPNVGQILTYSITIENKGPDAATGVSIEDIVPNGLSNVSNISNGGVMNSGTITWSGLSIASGSSVVLTYEAEVMAPGTGVSYKNVSQVTASDQYDIDSTPDNDDGDQSEDDEDNEEVTPLVADLNLIKTVNDSSPSIGDEVTFTITVSNEGPDHATGVEVEDVVPSGYTNITSDDGSVNGNIVTFSGVDISAGSSIDLTLKAVVVAPAENISYSNIAEITKADQYDSDSTPDNGADTDGDGNIGSQDADHNQDLDDEDDGDDAIIIPNGTISGYVLEDVDNDDVGDDGVNGVEIKLLEAGTNSVLNTVTTNADGYYIFTGVEPGDYVVMEQDESEIDEDFVDVYDGDDSPEDSNDAVDNLDDDMISVTIEAGEMDMDNNFVEEQLGSLSGYVQLDDDNDDSGDSPQVGVIVELKDELGNDITSVVTDDNGYYEFINLEPDTYIVTTTNPAHSQSISDQDQSPDGDSSDSDLTVDNSIMVVVTPGEDDTDNNFVDELFGIISGQVSEKSNDGSVVVIEIEGIEIKLINENDEVVSTTLTDNTGYFEFTDVAPGNYTLMEQDESEINPDYIDLYDGDETPEDGVDGVDNLDDDMIQVVLHAGEHDADNNFVEQRLASIGDMVWFDLNGNGILDSGEVGLPGIEVTLLDGSGIPLTQDGKGNPVTPIITDDEGKYLFDDLIPGRYYVKFGESDILEFSPQNQGSDEDLDSDADPVTGITEAIILDGGDEITSVDAGYYSFGAIGNYVWLDANYNGIQEANEVGLNDIVVNLYTDNDSDGNPDQVIPVQSKITSTNPTTGKDGYYVFENLSVGLYLVEFVKSDDTEFTIPNYSGKIINAHDEGDDSDADATSGLSHLIVLHPGEFNDKVDAGLYYPMTLGDLIWVDDNNDGLYNPGEQPLIGVELALWTDDDNDGSPDTDTGRKTFTNFTGNYTFKNLTPGNYVVQVVPANFEVGQVLHGFVSSTGNDPTPDPDVDPSNMDDNGYNPNLGIGVISRTVTLVSDDEPVNDGDTSPNTNLTVDFGFFKTGRIGDYVWEDSDADGIQDVNEDGMNGIDVHLYNGTTNELITSTITSQNPNNAAQQGYYEFTGLFPGDYYIKVDMPSGYFVTDANQGGNDNLDSDLDNSNGENTTQTYTIGTADNNMSIDIGMFKEAKVGDYLWREVTGGMDNVQDPTDIGVNNMLVELFEVGTNNLIADQITHTGPEGTDGYYMFTGLKPGNYYIKFHKFNDFEFVIPNFGGDDMNDSDVIDPIVGLTSAFVVNAGDCIEDIDAGIRASALPVELISFYGEYNEERDVNELTWVTASEINNDYFQIERAIDGDNFASIGRVEGNGNSNHNITYTFDDINVLNSGTYYYRLKQFDFDGSFEYSKVISIRIDKVTDEDIQIFPNPAVDQVNINIDWKEGASVKVYILDAQGKMVMDHMIDRTLEYNSQSFNVPVYDLPKGVYFFRVEVENAVFNKKVLIIE